jgi:hypothetical protein
MQVTGLRKLWQPVEVKEAVKLSQGKPLLMSLKLLMLSKLQLTLPLRN